MTEEEIQQLQQENETLKERLAHIDEKKKKSLKFKLFLTKKVATFFIGNNLKQSIKNAITEFNEDKKLSKDTIADVTANVIWRFTRIGIVGVVIALLPTVLLIQQNWIITKQNKLFEKQNTKIDIQTQLEEASRRSSQMFIMGEVLGDLNKELNDSNNKKRVLSKTLVGRIIGLSRAMKPYKYLRTDSLSYEGVHIYKDSLKLKDLVSPERGQLLITLCKSNIDSVFFEENISGSKETDFSYAELNVVDFSGADLRGAYLIRSDLTNSDLSYANLNEAFLNEANLQDSELTHTFLIGAMLRNTNFKSAYMSEAKLQEAVLINSDLSSANLYKANLTEANLRGANLRKSDLRFVVLDKADLSNIKSLDSARVHRYDWLNYIKDTLQLKGAEKIFKNYRIDSILYPYEQEKAPMLIKKTTHYKK